MAIVLEEDIEENYEPSASEIQEYAEWLGMNWQEDQSLAWIAREGLKAPLPHPWKPCQSSEGEIFYFNFKTGESSWDHPCDDHYRRVYQRAKAKRDAPVRVVSIDGWQDPGALPHVRCANTLTGEEMAVLRFKPRVNVHTLRTSLAKRLSMKARYLRLMLHDGRILTEEDDNASLLGILGIKALTSDGDDDNCKERTCIARGQFDLYWKKAAKGGLPSLDGKIASACLPGNPLPTSARSMPDLPAHVDDVIAPGMRVRSPARSSGNVPGPAKENQRPTYGMQSLRCNSGYF